MAEIRSFAFLILLIHALSSANGASAFSFEEWCGRTTRSNVCLDTIRQDPRSGLKNDPNGLCTILNDKSKAFAESTFYKIKDALDHAADPGTKQALQTCLDAYDESLGILRPLNFSVIDGKTWELLYSSLQSAQQGPKECDGVTPRFSAEDTFLVDVVAVTSDIVNLVECDKVLCE